MSKLKFAELYCYLAGLFEYNGVYNNKEIRIKLRNFKDIKLAKELKESIKISS